MPVYNEERQLARALDSWLSQEYDYFEVIVCDNASTDTTGQICHEYAARDPRIRYYRNDRNIGSVNNFNKAFALSRGDYFVWAAGHDLRHPTFLARCLAVLEEDAMLALCHPQVRWIDSAGTSLGMLADAVDTRGKGQLARFNAILWGLASGFPVYGVFRASMLRRTRLFTSTIAPDLVLLAELSLLGTFAHLPEPLLFALKPEDFGSWDVYMQKCFNARLSFWSSQRLFLQMVYGFLRLVILNVRGYRAKCVGIASVLLCMFTKYSRVFAGLLLQSVARRLGRAKNLRGA